MYRIEFEPGDVGVFRTVEEIATAIKSGAITSRSRIYHQASDKWLPIEFHPHYKRALEIVAGGGAPAAAASASPPVSSVTPSGPRRAVQVSSPPAPVAEPRVPLETAPEPSAPAPQAFMPPAPLPPALPVASASYEEPHETPIHDPAPHPVLEAEPAAQAEPHAAPVMLYEHAREERAEERAAEAPESGAYSEPLALFIPLDPPGEPTHDTSADGSTVPAVEPRPIFRPRLRLALSGKPRRPFIVAFGAIAVAFGTQVGVSSFDLSQRFEQGIRSLASLGPSVRTASESVLPTLTPARASAGKSSPAAARAVRKPEPALGGSPSFGTSSAFSSAGSPAGLHGLPPMSGGAPPAAHAESVDSAPALAPAPTGIAIAAPAISIGKPAASSKLTPTGLVNRYQAAYAAARAELETGLRTAGFADVLASERLSSPQGVRTARLAVGTASAYVAKYHRREAEIEAAYADSFAVLSQQPGWSADARRAWEKHQVLQEKPEIAKLGMFLLAQMDSMYGVLAGQEGAYQVTGGTIAFQDAAAAHAYAELRPWLDRKAHQWADSGSGPPTTAARVLRAMGTTRLPEGGAL